VSHGGGRRSRSACLSIASLAVTITAVDRTIASGLEGHRRRDATGGAHGIEAGALGAATAAVAATTTTTTAAALASTFLLARLSLLATASSRPCCYIRQERSSYPVSSSPSAGIGNL